MLLVQLLSELLHKFKGGFVVFDLLSLLDLHSRLNLLLQDLAIVSILLPDCGDLVSLLPLQVIKQQQVLLLICVFQLHAPVQPVLVLLHCILDHVQASVTGFLLSGAQVDVDFRLGLQNEVVETELRLGQAMLG